MSSRLEEGLLNVCIIALLLESHFFHLRSILKADIPEVVLFVELFECVHHEASRQICVILTVEVGVNDEDHTSLLDIVVT